MGCTKSVPAVAENTATGNNANQANNQQAQQQQPVAQQQPVVQVQVQPVQQQQVQPVQQQQQQVQQEVLQQKPQEAKGRAPIVYIIYYSMYGHIAKMAQAVKKGVESTGAVCKVWQVAETLSSDVLAKMHAPPQDASIPIIRPDQLVEADAIIFGVPTRFGALPAQLKAFFDATGQLWLSGALVGKVGSVFFSTATIGGGQETTALTTYTQFVHHGMLIVPMGYTTQQLFEPALHGGSPYGAGTFSAADGSRQPSATELSIAEHQGKHVATFTVSLVRGKSA